MLSPAYGRGLLERSKGWIYAEALATKKLLKALKINLGTCN